MELVTYIEENSEWKENKNEWFVEAKGRKEGGTKYRKAHFAKP